MGLLTRCQVSDSCTAHLEMRTRTKSVVARTMLNPGCIPSSQNGRESERPVAADVLGVLLLQSLEVDD